jgi:NADPH:quinone reductase-like Zn-dependent oxidoreductase
MGYVLKAFALSALVPQQGRPFVAIPTHGDLVFLKGLAESGKLRPVVDRTYSLSDTPEAFRHLAQGHARGKVVITLGPSA